MGPDAPGFVRFAYTVQVEDAPGAGATLRVPAPVTEAGEPAPLLACLLLDSGDATWRVDGSGRGARLALDVRGASAYVRGSFLIDAFSNETLAGNNWTLAPLDPEMTVTQAPPQDAPNAFPIGTTSIDAGSSGTKVRVYFALDASPDDRVVAHRQDVAEVTTQAGPTPATVYRDFRTLR